MVRIPERYLYGISDKDLYGIVAQEIASETIDTRLWLKASNESGENYYQALVLYLKLRVLDLMNQRNSQKEIPSEHRRAQTKNISMLRTQLKRLRLRPANLMKEPEPSEPRYWNPRRTSLSLFEDGDAYQVWEALKNWYPRRDHVILRNVHPSLFIAVDALPRERRSSIYLPVLPFLVLRKKDGQGWKLIPRLALFPSNNSRYADELKFVLENIIKLDVVMYDAGVKPKALLAEIEKIYRKRYRNPPELSYSKTVTNKSEYDAMRFVSDAIGTFPSSKTLQKRREEWSAQVRDLHKKRQALMGRSMEVFPEVALSSLIADNDTLDKPLREFLRISSVDFLVATPAASGGRAIVVVEFDGPLHRTSEKKILADQKKNKLCDLAGLPLIRIHSDQWHEDDIPVPGDKPDPTEGMLRNQFYRRFLHHVLWRIAEMMGLATELRDSQNSGRGKVYLVLRALKEEYGLTFPVHVKEGMIADSESNEFDRSGVLEAFENLGVSNSWPHSRDAWEQQTYLEQEGWSVEGAVTCVDGEWNGRLHIQRRGKSYRVQSPKLCFAFSGFEVDWLPRVTQAYIANWLIAGVTQKAGLKLPPIQF